MKLPKKFKPSKAVVVLGAAITIGLLAALAARNYLSNRVEAIEAQARGKTVDLVVAKVDLDKGFWWSSSNQELAGVIGVERQLSAMIDDPQSEVNLLNEVGITTVFNSYGTGLRLWGNRSAAWPTVTHMRNFENVRRTGDVINESIRYFSQQYIDMPLNQALIDSLVESVNGYGRKLIGDAVGYYQAVADWLELAGALVNDKWIVSWDGSGMRKDQACPRVEVTLTEVFDE